MGQMGRERQHGAADFTDFCPDKELRTSEVLNTGMSKRQTRLGRERQLPHHRWKVGHWAAKTLRQ